MTSLTCIDVNGPNVEQVVERDGSIRLAKRIPTNRPWDLRGEAIAGRHLWLCRDLYHNACFISDELHDRLKRLTPYCARFDAAAVR